MSRGMRNAALILLGVMTALAGGLATVSAQGADAPSESLKRIRTALQSPRQPIGSDGVPVFSPSNPDEVRLGVLTLLPPDTPGEVVSIRIPVGALVSRAAHAVLVAQHRRAENAARDEVARAFVAFQQSRSK